MKYLESELDQLHAAGMTVEEAHAELDRRGATISPADEAQMALCHLDFICNLPGVHPHRVAVIRGALDRLARV